MSDLGKYLRQLRKKRKLPLRVVAAYVKVSTSYLSDIEFGRRLNNNPNPELLVAFADFFKVPVTTFLEKGGYEVEAHKEQYKDFVKVVRNKKKATFMVEKLGIMRELVTNLDLAAVSMPSIRGTVKNLMITLGELESLIVKRG